MLKVAQDEPRRRLLRASRVRSLAIAARTSAAVLTASTAALAAPATAALAAPATAALAAPVTAVPPSVTGFTAVTSPNVPKSNYNELDAVAAVSPRDAWAVGFARTTGLLFHVLVEHWNGTAWSIRAPAPLPAATDTRLHALAALASTNVWAVGSDASHSLIEHWNGSSWSVVPSPSAEPSGSSLQGISAVSPSDIWAVGTSGSGSGFSTLIEHWNGTAWSVVPGAPLLATGFNFLTGVAAVSASDVWAVGRMFRHPTPVIEHWDGTGWAQVAQPVSGYDSSLNAISAVNATDIWAVGEQNLNQTVTEHWDGTNWTLVPSPSVTANNAQDTLSGVRALGTGDVWAVGSTLQSFTTDQTLAEHWNGTRWQIVPTANPAPGSNAFSSVAGSGIGQPLWAVGFGTRSGQPQYSTLVETTTG
jgi:hypothetical protein